MNTIEIESGKVSPPLRGFWNWPRRRRQKQRDRKKRFNDTLRRLLDEHAERERRAEEILHEAHALPQWRRLGHVHLSCGDDAWLLRCAVSLLNGPSLAGRIDEGNLTLEQILDIAASLALELHLLHIKGTIHGNVNTGNIVLTSDDRFLHILNASTAATNPGPELDLRAYGAVLKAVVRGRKAPADLRRIIRELTLPDRETPYPTAKEIQSQILDIADQRQRANEPPRTDFYLSFVALLLLTLLLRYLTG